jgi:O-succinylbenzoic acid--CoA ligase
MKVNTSIRTELLYQNRMVKCFWPRPANLDAMFRAIAQTYAHKEAVVYQDERLTYGLLDQQVGQVATGLRKAGLLAGERIAVFVGNRTEFVISVLAILRLGAICVPIGVRQSALELRYILNQSSVSALIFEDYLSSRIPAVEDVQSLRVLWRIDGSPQTGEFAFDQLKSVENEPLPVQSIDEHSTAIIMYTSGTTGRPKGAMLTHLGFFHTAKNYETRFGYDSDSRSVMVVPGSHISGLLAVFVVMLQVGGCTILIQEFDALELLGIIERERITSTVMVPAMYNLCLLTPEFERFDLSSWKIGHFGGAAMPEVSIQRLAQKLPQLRLYNGYGATETTSAVTLSSAQDTITFLDSVGTVLDCVDIRVLDENACEVSPGESGEIFVQSPGNAIGYWDNLQATQSEFIGGYWRSGDIGSIDASGRMRLLDRRKDMINRGGFKVYSTEVEGVLHRIAGVVDAAVVPTPCEILGERVHAFIFGPPTLTLSEVRAHCAQYLADYKRPDYLTVMNVPLPRNLNGKIVKQPLREEALRMAHARL